jgi:predicted acylesterase/phospholipase RssA
VTPPPRSAARSGEWLHLDEVMREISADSSEGEPAVAFAISGGGASGAYEAGVIDAWLRLAAARYPEKRFLRPRFILGSSAGALNAVTTLLASLQGEAGFGYQIWKAIAPRSAPFVVGPWRTPLVDLATRWLKVPLGVVLAIVALLSAGVVLLLPPRVIAFLAAAAIVALGLVFRRAVFPNRALARTIACVLSAAVDRRTGRIPARSLLRRRDPRQASKDFVQLWYRASESARAQGGDLPPGLIVTATDVTNSEANLFTLVEPGVFSRLVDRRWQAMQLSNAPGPPAGYQAPEELSGGWVESDQFVTCVVASTSIPGVFPSQRIELRSIAGNGRAQHDFVDGGVLNNTPIHIAIDAGATHVVSFELEPLKHVKALEYLAEGDPPSLGRNVVQTFETLIAHSTSQGIAAACAWNRNLVSDPAGAAGKRLVPIFRMAPRRRDLNLIDFDGHYESPLSRARPSLEDWLRQGRDDAEREALFWNGTFEAHPAG